MGGVGASSPCSANGDTRSDSIKQVTRTGSGRGMPDALGVRQGACSQERSKGPGTSRPLLSWSVSTPRAPTVRSAASVQVAALSAIELQPTSAAAATATTARMEQVVGMVRVAIERTAPFILVWEPRVQRRIQGTHGRGIPDEHSVRSCGERRERA